MCKKYSGEIYEGIACERKNANHNFLFNSPYDALENANRVWDSNPELQIPRLLAVCEKTTYTNGDQSIKFAFFQFKDSKSCLEYISQNTVIKWSDYKTQIWNGNANFM